jgi:hypothetical protein
MKKIYLTSVLSLITFLGFSQSDAEPKTLFGNTSFENLSFVINPYSELGSIGGAEMLSLGVRGGVNVNSKYTFGGYYMGSLNNVRPAGTELLMGYMDMRAGGVYFEYTLLNEKLVHLTFPLNIGYGEVQWGMDNDEISFGERNFFTVEPTALIEVNLHKYVKANLGGGYRWVSDFNYLNINANDLRGVVGQLGLKIVI